MEWNGVNGRWGSRRNEMEDERGSAGGLIKECRLGGKMKGWKGATWVVMQGEMN